MGGIGSSIPRYSEERKAATLKKLLPPQSRSVNSVADEDGISPQTLYHWLKQCREQGVAVPGHQKQAAVGDVALNPSNVEEIKRNTAVA
ncbi:transposase [Pseudoalteromonas prydzensis]|uniref:transposase n=1 Tax=Pseudoalteromonas prydzensis TaxID=182141 RepID=UPI003D2F70C4